MIHPATSLPVPLNQGTQDPQIASKNDSKNSSNPQSFAAIQEENTAVSSSCEDKFTGHWRCLDEENNVESDFEGQKSRVAAIDWVQYWFWRTKGCRHIDSLAPLVLKKIFLKSCTDERFYAETVVELIYNEWKKQSSHDVDSLIAHHVNVCLNFTSKEFSDEKIEQVWELLGLKLVEIRAESDQDLPASPLTRMAQRLGSKQISFATLSSFLQLLAFRWLMVDPTKRKLCSNLISLTLHEGAAAIRVTIPSTTQKSTLVLPFTPQKALNCLQNTLLNPTLEECFVELVHDFALSHRFVLDKESPLIKEADNLLFNNKEIHASAIELLYHPLRPIQQIAVDMLHASHALQPTFSTFRSWLEFLPEILVLEYNPAHRTAIHCLLERSFSIFLPELHHGKKEKFLNLLLKHIQKPDFDPTLFVANVLPWMTSVKHKKIIRSTFSIWFRWSATLTPKQAKSLGLSLYRTSVIDSPELGLRIASILFEKKMVDSKGGQVCLSEIADFIKSKPPLSQQLQIHFSFVYLLKLLRHHYPKQIMESEKYLFSLLANLLEAEKKDQVLSLSVAAGNQHVVSDSAFLSATAFLARKPTTSDSKEIQDVLQPLFDYLAENKEPSRFELYVYLVDTIATSYRPINGLPQKKIEDICLEIFQLNPSILPDAFIKIMRHCLKSNLLITNRRLANLWLKTCARAWKENVANGAALWIAGNQLCIWNYLDKRKHAKFLFSFGKSLLESDHPGWRDLGATLLRTLKSLFQGQSYPELEGYLEAHRMELYPGSSKIPVWEKVIKHVETLIKNNEFGQAYVAIEMDLLPFLAGNGDCLNRLQKIVAEFFSYGQYSLCLKICLLHPGFKVDLLGKLHQLSVKEFAEHPRELRNLLLETMNAAKEAHINPISFREKATDLVNELLNETTSDGNDNKSSLKPSLELLHFTIHPNHDLWLATLERILKSKDVDLCKFANKCLQERVDNLLTNKKKIDNTEPAQWIKLDAIRIHILWLLRNNGEEPPLEHFCSVLLQMLNQKDPLNLVFPDRAFQEKRFLSCLLVWLKEASAAPPRPDNIVEFERIAHLRPTIYAYLADCVRPHKHVKIETLFVSILLKSTKGENFIQALNIFAGLLTLPAFPDCATQQHLDMVLEFTKGIKSLPLAQRNEGMFLLSGILNTFKQKMAQHPKFNMDSIDDLIGTNLSLLIDETATNMLQICQLSDKDDSRTIDQEPFDEENELCNSRIYSKLQSLCQSDEEKELREAEAIVKLNQHGLNPIQLINVQRMLARSQVRFAYKNNLDSSREFSIWGVEMLEHIIIPSLGVSTLDKEFVKISFNLMTTLFTHPNGLMRYKKTCIEYFKGLLSDYCVLPSSALPHKGKSLDPALLKDYAFERKKMENAFEISPRQILNRYFNTRLSYIFSNYYISEALDLSSIDNLLNKLLDRVDADFPNFKLTLPSTNTKDIVEASDLLLKCLLLLCPQDSFQKELLDYYCLVPLIKLFDDKKKAPLMIESYICSLIWTEEPNYSIHRRHSLFLLDAVAEFFPQDHPLIPRMQLYLKTSVS